MCGTLISAGQLKVTSKIGNIKKNVGNWSKIKTADYEPQLKLVIKFVISIYLHLCYLYNI